MAVGGLIQQNLSPPRWTRLDMSLISPFAYKHLGLWPACLSRTGMDRTQGTALLDFLLYQRRFQQIFLPKCSTSHVPCCTPPDYWSIPEEKERGVD